MMNKWKGFGKKRNGKENDTMGPSVEEINQVAIDMAYRAVESAADTEEAIAEVRKLYNNIHSDGFLLAKRRQEMILFRLLVLNNYSVEKRIGAVDRLRYVMDSKKSAAYRTDVIRRFDATLDRRQALEYLKQSAEYSDAGEKEKAFDYALKSAREGSTLAAYYVAKLLMEGEGCEQDEFLSAFWCWQSVNMNHEDAIGPLAYRYHEGIGVWPGRIRALYYFALGAAMHLDRGCIQNLAIMLGDGVIPGAEEHGDELEAMLDQLDREDVADAVRRIASAVNAMAAEWLMENEGGI